MKTLGIIGGIGPESTIEYYRQILKSYREQTRDGSSPSIIINSIDVRRMLGYVEINDLDGLIKYLMGSVQSLARAGSGVGLIAANTPHIVFDELAANSPIPLISIVQSTCLAVKALGLKAVALCGTRATMQMDFYKKVLVKHGIRMVVPELEDQNFIHEIYMNELLNGIILPETRLQLLRIVNRMISSERIQGVILGGTELALILTEPSYNGVPFINTTKVHADSAVEYLLTKGIA